MASKYNADIFGDKKDGDKMVVLEGIEWLYLIFAHQSLNIEGDINLGRLG